MRYNARLGSKSRLQHDFCTQYEVEGFLRPMDQLCAETGVRLPLLAKRLACWCFLGDSDASPPREVTSAPANAKIHSIEGSD